MTTPGTLYCITARHKTTKAFILWSGKKWVPITEFFKYFEDQEEAKRLAVTIPTPAEFLLPSVVEMNSEARDWVWKQQKVSMFT